MMNNNCVCVRGWGAVQMSNVLQPSTQPRAAAPGSAASLSVQKILGCENSRASLSCLLACPITLRSILLFPWPVIWLIWGCVFCNLPIYQWICFIMWKIKVSIWLSNSTWIFAKDSSKKDSKSYIHRYEECSMPTWNIPVIHKVDKIVIIHCSLIVWISSCFYKWRLWDYSLCLWYNNKQNSSRDS